MIVFALWLAALVLATDPGIDLIKTISSATGPMIMAIIIVGAIKEWWVPGVTHRRTVKRLDTLLDVQMENTSLQNRTVTVAESRLSISEELARLSTLVQKEEKRK